ncbi:HNH endonuclease [bacterium]|nr:HNH endonuclease [bacterium]
MPKAPKSHVPASRPTRRHQDTNRPNAHQRGYCSDRWRRLRLMVLNRDLVCQVCGVVLSRSFHCDHIVPKKSGGQDTMENLQALCNKCHSIKTKEGL